MKSRRIVLGGLLTAVVIAACSAPPGEREFRAGLREFKRGQYVRAKNLLEKSINRRPGSEANAVAYNYLGLAAWKLGLSSEAQEAFENSRRLSPVLPDPVYNLGVLLAESGDAARAARILGEAALMAPADARALEYLGGMFAARRQWPEARRALYAALSRSPKSPSILTAIANVELGSGAPDQAVVTLLKALEMNERYAPALFNLAVIQQSHLRDNEQAVAYFGKYLAVAPTDDPHVAGARDALAALRGERAEEGDRVSPVVTPAVQEQPLVAAPVTNAAEPVPPKPVAASADDVLNQAVRLADKGKTQLALELALQVAGNAERAGNIELQERALRTAVRGAFDQPRAHYELGRFLMAQKKPEAALKSFKQAIVLDNKFAAAQVAMAEAAVQAGEIDAALSGLKQAAQNDPKNPEALYALARLYDEQLDVPEKAARAYAEFATKFPKDSRAAGAREQAKKLWPSIQFPEYVPVPSGATPITVTARVAAASSPAPGVPARRIVYKKPAQKNNRAALQALDRGNHYQEQGKWNDAIDFYTRSLESDDEVASTWYNLGVAYAVKRDFDLAKDAYLRALALQPSQDNARYNLALIYCEQNDPASAIALLKEVVKNNSGHAAAHYVLGYLYDKHESTIPLAKQHYREYLRLTPNDPSARAVRQWLSDHS